MVDGVSRTAAGDVTAMVDVWLGDTTASDDLFVREVSAKKCMKHKTKVIIHVGYV